MEDRGRGVPATTALAKNRRYAKLQQLIDGDDYFSEEAVKLRDPLLFHMYVGRFSDRNASVKEPASLTDLSKFLFQRIDKGEYETGLKEAYESHLVNHGESYFKGQLDEAMETDKDGKDLTLTEAELEDNEDELIRIMHKRFLDGFDQGTDYAQIDADESLDDPKQIGQDQEDKYFDSEEQAQAALLEGATSVYTGVLDY